MKNLSMKKRAMATVALGLTLAAGTAAAATETKKVVQKVKTYDGGTILIDFDGTLSSCTYYACASTGKGGDCVGGKLVTTDAATVHYDDAGREAILSVALAALLSGRTVNADVRLDGSSKCVLDALELVE